MPSNRTGKTPPNRRQKKPQPSGAKPATARPKKSPSRSLQDAVGPQVYQTWVDMLKTLVPDGRTHRLSLVVAAMLQYALAMAENKRYDEVDEQSVIQSLLDSTEVSDSSEVKALLHDAVVQLFKDARVEYSRTSSRGHSYSITDGAYEEYIHWFSMPWE